MKRRWIKPWSLALALLAFAAGAQGAGAARLHAVPDDLQRALTRLAQARGFTARFEQEISFRGGGAQRYRGEVAVLRPGRFRWRYTSPYEQLYVSDGQRIWHYEPDLMQVQVMRSLQGVDPTVMKLLDGSIDPRQLTVLDIARDAGGARRYHARVGDVTVWIGLAGRASAARLAYVERVDALGNRNVIRLLEMKLAPPPASLFAFTPPRGVDVLPLD